jgi:acetyl esterase/lipase
MRISNLFCITVAIWISLSSVLIGWGEEPKEILLWPGEVGEIKYFCSVDQSQQPVMFYAPIKNTPVPLLVGLHTWSGDYRQRDPGVHYARWCVEKDWAFIYPNFRGPNKIPQATGSKFVVQDILDAVIYATKKVNIDANRIYLIGTSGGGYTALLIAGRASEIWAGVSVWVPIVDLVAWYQESIDRKNRYAVMIEASVGGIPTPGTKAYAECIKRSPITYLKNARGLPVDINAGIFDGHSGSVPISHSLRAFNCIADAKDKILDAEINYFVQKAKVPESLTKPILDLAYGKKKPLFRRSSGKARITIFDGGHEIVPQAALSWLAKQRKSKESVNHN